MADILFVCVHNGGRSQMAKALFNSLARQRGLLLLLADSAGTQPVSRVNPRVAEVMSEIGIDVSGERPKLLTNGLVEGSGRVITMGCAVDAEACPALFLKDVEDWGLPDPSGKSAMEIRPIREAIKAKVEHLLDSMASTVTSARKVRKG